jgi:hypothetical protein
MHDAWRGDMMPTGTELHAAWLACLASKQLKASSALPTVHNLPYAAVTEQCLHNSLHLAMTGMQGGTTAGVAAYICRGTCTCSNRELSRHMLLLLFLLLLDHAAALLCLKLQHLHHKLPAIHACMLSPLR